VVIDIGDASGNRGAVVGFAVGIDTAHQSVAGATVCIGYDVLTPIRAIAGAPDCNVPAALGKQGEFVFQPSGCTPGTTCRRACAEIGGSAAPIETGATLFSCRVAISPEAELTDYPLTCSVPIATDPNGDPLDTTCTEGVVIVQNNIPGDCNGDGVVTINELILGVNIALGSLPLTECPAFDTNHDGRVTIEELIAAVNAAQNT
jgi:hypothetical protein